jgi:hypothetical protein
MALVNESANEFDFELQRLSETVHRRFPEQSDTLATQRIHDRTGILDFRCWASLCLYCTDGPATLSFWLRLASLSFEHLMSKSQPCGVVSLGEQEATWPDS